MIGLRNDFRVRGVSHVDRARKGNNTSLVLFSGGLVGCALKA